MIVNYIRMCLGKSGSISKMLLLLCGPPIKPEPPEMIVETVQFNPSVCTCGEHGCQPQYRMEKRVLWTNEKVRYAKKQSKVNDREKKTEYRENNLEEIIRKQDRGIGNLIESQEIGIKEENDQKVCLKIEGDDTECGSVEHVKEKMSGDYEVRSGYKANYAGKEKENVEAEGDDNNDDEKEEEKEEIVCKNEVGYRDSKNDNCIVEGANNTYNIKENTCNRIGRSDRDKSEGRNSEEIDGEKCIGNDSETAFKNDCNLSEKSSNEDQIDKDQTTGEDDRAVDRDKGGDDGENRILINNADETAESYSFKNMDEGLEVVEIASTFGIMSIYCNSELHSWMSFEGIDASKRYLDVSTSQNAYILK